MKMHSSVTVERVMEASQRYHSSLDNPGICIECGAESEGHEPDARNHECESCGATQVFGADELLLQFGAAA